MNRRMRILGALATALSVGAAIAGAGGPEAEATPSPSRCVHLGLEPIPVTVRAGARYTATGTPEFEVEWSGKSFPSDCEARRSAEVEVTVWFPHLRFAFAEGLPTPWWQFWNGRKTVHDERKRVISPASYNGLECPYKARARLRYEVTGPHGAVLGRRVVPVPVELLPCPARIRSKEPPRNG